MPDNNAMPVLTRRSVLAGASAMALAPALPAWAEAPMLGVSFPKHRRVTVGDFEVTTLLAATAAREEPQKIFGLNVPAEEFARVSAEANIPADRVQFFFTPVAVNTGQKLVLFDTGLNPQGITGALADAGYEPGQVDLVVITHMHGDHIGGLMGEAGATFPNAEYVTGRVEFDHWAGAGNERFDQKVRPLAERFSFVEGGASPVSGITAIEAFGHTPGHMVWMLESAGEQLLLAADFANHYVWSLARPDWEVRFDMDKARAAETRKRLLDMLATDRIPFSGYHMPFPSTGFVERTSDGGYRFQPESYQLML